jgi:uracil phosphoribosyltransferase
MFWGLDAYPVTVCTQADLDTFTHIIYLYKPEEILVQQRNGDTTRLDRKPLPAEHLERWQETEVSQLEGDCMHNRIIYTTIRGANVEEKALRLLEDFQEHDEQENMKRVFKELDDHINAVKNTKELKTVLIFDGDGTLTDKDTGKLFWEKVTPDQRDPLKRIFSSPLGYTYTAFRQAMIKYAEVDDLVNVATNVAGGVCSDKPLHQLLGKIVSSEHAIPIIVTSGLKDIWNKIMENALLKPQPFVFGASSPELCMGRQDTLRQGYVVTPEVKSQIVAHLQEKHGLFVWAFGDGLVDMPMLKQAHRSIVVTRDDPTRSQLMGTALQQAVDQDDLFARQLVFETDTSAAYPREELVSVLPAVDLFTRRFDDEMLRSPPLSERFIEATGKTASQLLCSSTRDRNVSSVALRKAHKRAGWYLAVEYLTHAIGLEKYTIQTVQGKPTNAFRLKEEAKTLIVPLMRGGEPMAMGVSEAFPLATFVHAKVPSDLQAKHLNDQATVILVDWVINTGKGILEFVKHIRRLNSDIRIFIVAGVVQEGATKGVSDLVRALTYCEPNSLVALRLSTTKYTGKGKTDTGHRLFNTTHLD